MSDLPNPAPDSPRMNGCPKCGKTAARIVPADRARISTLGEVLECLGCGEQYELRLAMLSVSASIAGTPEQTDAPHPGVAEVAEFHDLAARLRSAPRREARICDRCGLPESRHTDIQKFCPFYSTFRAATPASSAEPEGVTPSFDDAYRRLDSFATGGPDPDVEMLRRDVFALLERFDRHTPKSAQSKHVCGLQGFGALDDVCEACNENAAACLAQRSASPASETATTARPCTCHPADNPPRPCAEKYALSDCRPSADPSVTTDAETVNLPGWCLYCGGTYRTFAPGLAGCDNRECVRHPYINEANAAKKAAAWRGTPESSPAVDDETVKRHAAQAHESLSAIWGAAHIAGKTSPSLTDTLILGRRAIDALSATTPPASETSDDVLTFEEAAHLSNVIARIEGDGARRIQHPFVSFSDAHALVRHIRALDREIMALRSASRAEDRRDA